MSWKNIGIGVLASLAAIALICRVGALTPVYNFVFAENK